MGGDTHHLNVYPTDEQASRWADRAEEWDMGTSEFIKAAVEAGLKNFDAAAGAPSAGERAAELHDQRDRERRKNARLRDRLRECEYRLARTDEGYLLHAMDAVESGITFEQAVATVRATTTSRVERLLTEMETAQTVFAEPDENNQRVYRLANPNDAPTTKDGTPPFDAEAVLFGPQGVLQQATEAEDEDGSAPDDAVYDSDWLDDHHSDTDEDSDPDGGAL